MKVPFQHAIVLLCVAFGLGRIYSAPAYPLKISEDRRCLVDQANVPFLLCGDSPWSLMVRLSKTQAQQYLEDRRQKGFNAVIVNLIEHKFSSPAPKNIYGLEPFKTPGDYSKPNEAYFLHADSVIKMAGDLGMAVLLAPSFLGAQCKEEGWCEEMKAAGPEKLRGYGRFVGNRYKNQHNIIWLHAGNADAAENGITQLVEAIIYGIKDADTVKPKLHTAQCTRGSSALDCYDLPWLDLNNTYADCDNALKKSREDYRRWVERKVPFFFIKGSYENEKADALCLRVQAFGSVLSGSSGYFFGNCPLWHFGSSREPCGAINWQAALNTEGAAAMGHIAALFNSRSWTKLAPELERAVVISGDSGMIAARAADSSLAIVFMPTARRFTVDMARMAGPHVKAWWYRPVTGEAFLIDAFPATGPQSLQPPGAGDWALVLDNAALPLPDPGKTSAGAGKKK